MPFRVIPFRFDPEADIESQMAALMAIVIGNLMGLAVLQGKLELQRHPELQACPPPILDTLPKLSAILFFLASLYFLALSWRDMLQNPSLPLRLLVYGNLLAAGAVLIKLWVVFQAPPESEAAVESVEL